MELSTLLPGWVFDLVNAAVFAGLVAALLRLVRPVSAAAAAWTAAGGALLLWLATPAFGQDFLWQTGSVNYLWTMTATLWFVRPFVHPGWMPRLRRGAVLWFVLGLCSGWSMENQSAAACLLCTARLVQLRLHRQPLPRLLAAGAAGQWLGFVLLMAAPGNYHRSAGYGQAGLTPALLAARAVSYTAALWTQLWWLVLVAALLTLLLAVPPAPSAGDGTLAVGRGRWPATAPCWHPPTYPLRSMLGSTVLSHRGGAGLRQCPGPPPALAGACLRGNGALSGGAAVRRAAGTGRPAPGKRCPRRPAAKLPGGGADRGDGAGPACGQGPGSARSGGMRCRI